MQEYQNHNSKNPAFNRIAVGALLAVSAVMFVLAFMLLHSSKEAVINEAKTVTTSLTAETFASDALNNVVAVALFGSYPTPIDQAILDDAIMKAAENDDLHGATDVEGRVNGKDVVLRANFSVNGKSFDCTAIDKSDTSTNHVSCALAK